MADILKIPQTQKVYTGREQIFVDFGSSEITKNNILELLEKCLQIHELNRAEIEFLRDYKKGKMPICDRIKSVRPDIDNKISVNISFEVSEFWSSMLFGKPIQYLIKSTDTVLANDLEELRKNMVLCEKDSVDSELAEWRADVGTAYRLTLPNPNSKDTDEPKFNIYALEPTNCFVAYHNDVGKTPAFGCRYVKKGDDTIYTIWTNESVFTITKNNENKIVEKANEIGKIPLEEYPLNKDRIGAWERIIPIQDAINVLMSDGTNGQSQHVQSLLAIFASNLTDEEKQNIKESDGTNILILPKEAQIKYLNEALDQNSTTQLIDKFVTFAYDITGLPRKSGGQSTSDTGSAVQLREGWVQSGNRTKKDEKMFSKPERSFLKTVLAILRVKGGTKLELKDIEIRFTPMLFGNLYQKAQLADLLYKTGYDIKDVTETAELFLDVEGTVKRFIERKEKEDAINGNENGTGQIDAGSDNGNRENNQQPVELRGSQD